VILVQRDVDAARLEQQQRPVAGGILVHHVDGLGERAEFLQQRQRLYAYVHVFISFMPRKRWPPR